MRKLKYSCYLLATLLLAGSLGCGDDTDPNSPAQREPKSHGDQAGKQPNANETRLGIQSEPFGEVEVNEETYGIKRYLLSNDHGMTVSIIDYGAIVQSVFVPDKNGVAENVTLGFDNLNGYTNPEEKDPYFGAICGRYSNRIAEGKFSIDGKEYQLAINNDPNHLHGGNRGFNDVVWQSRALSNELTEDEAVGVELTYLSEDGEENYPGQLTVKVIYTLNNNNELKIEYDAVSTAPTPVNLTNHCYWNIGGVRLSEPQASDAVTKHALKLACDRYLPVDETMIPTGEMKPVAGTPFDFTNGHLIEQDFATVKGDAENGGYDHCFMINNWKPGQPPQLAARLSDPDSGRVMEILTDQPGLQFYTGNFLSAAPGDAGFPQHHACCLETQQLPDAPNQKDFPDTILQPGEVYRHVTIHRFSTNAEKN